MINRWKMNRIGFINFWLYDEEIFELKDGKILIRGSNGSGKSITTQSIVSFILDGDRSPERLDPFGSTGRKMEYYFLQDGEKDNQTGYIFLELKKDGVEQYITLGIGQRAMKGKSISFWGFILSDGRRIGVDIKLYREVGTERIPLAEKELERELGDKNRFASGQREYIEMVNKELFGFFHISYYKKLINFLLKIRTSKLSTGIKPADVYQILKDSLQVLEDSDLRVLAETLETMDNMQKVNEERQEAKQNLEIIKKEYDKYNRFVLWKKAVTYDKAKKEYEELKVNVDNLFSEIESLKNEINKDSENRDKTVKTLAEIKQEVEILESMDLEKHVRDLAQFENHIENSKKEFLENGNKLEEYKIKLKNHISNRRDEEKKSEEIKYIIKKQIHEMKEINEVLMFEADLENKEELYQENMDKKLEEIRNNLEVYQKNIELGLEAVKKYKSLSYEVGIEEEKLNNFRLEKEEKESELQKALFLEEVARDNLVENFYAMKEQNEFLKISRNELEKIVELIKKYEGLIEAGEIKRIVEKNYNIKNQEFQQEKLELYYQRNNKKKEYEVEFKNLEKLKNMEDNVPERKLETIKCREVLKKAGINFLSFYETVDFAENLSTEEKNILEAQLKDSGILDTLVIAYEDREKARQIIEKYSDVIIRTKENFERKQSFNKLVIENIDEKLKKPIENFLKNISLKTNTEIEENILILGKDGYFKNGVIEGYSIGEEEASFIGINTRKRKLEKIILAKEEKCADLLYHIENLENLIKDIESKIYVLKTEYENIPQFANLNTGIKLREETEQVLKRAVEKFETEEEELNRLKIQLREWNQKVIVRCRILPFARRVEEYEEAQEAAREYMKSIYDLKTYIQKYHISKNEVLRIEELEIKDEELIEFFTMTTKKIINEIERTKKAIKKINEILNTPENIVAAENLKKLEVKKLEMQNLYLELEKSITRAIAIVEEKENIYNNESIKIQEKKKIVEKTENFYKEELELGYVSVKEGDTEKKLEKIEDVFKLIKDKDKEKSLETVSRNLLNKFNENRGMLENYMAGTEDIFDDDPVYCRKRIFIRMIEQGKKLSLYEFEKVLQNEIAQGELAIEDKDKELIIDILTGNIGHKMNDYIYESKIWIKDMTKIMMEMETSMKLKFSLDWKAKEKLSEEELDISELENLLRKDVELLPSGDLEKISKHFKSKLKLIRNEMEGDERGENNYMQAIKKILDYREWFEFKIYIHREGKPKKELTNDAYNKFSGGEKAMSIYIPLLAAASAQYKKAKEDCPRIIALDEAFAGIDDKNISSMFELIEKLDFDYIMNSQQLWGCYETVKNLRIAELVNLRDLNMIRVNRFFWNGKKKILEI